VRHPALEKTEADPVEVTSPSNVLIVQGDARLDYSYSLSLDTRFQKLDPTRLVRVKIAPVRSRDVSWT
jgi:hypothetical protein